MAKRPKRTKTKANEQPRVRMAILLAVFFVCFFFIFLRLFYLQVIDRSDQLARQIDQSVDQITIKASRGNIYDRNHNILVKNASAKAVYIVPISVTNEKKLLNELTEKLKLTKSEKKSVRKKINQLENDTVEVANGMSSSRGNRAKRLDKALSFKNNTLYVRPDQVKDAESTARKLSEIIRNMSYKEILAKLTQKENSALLVESKVDNAVANRILKDMTTKSEDGTETTNGVELIDDSRRYYTNGTFASYVLGFTNQEHVGVNGVESYYNSWLSGEDGIAYLQQDASGNTLPSQTRTVKEPTQGKDLVLTLDSNVQMMAEKALDQALEDWDAKRGTAIVLDIKTGEVLAMASNPSYNLNNPSKLNKKYAKNYEEEFEGKSKSYKLNSLWRNPAISFTYEPGSTFKPITASTAFEEGAISPDDQVICEGKIQVEDATIRCTSVHGVQTAAEAVTNSCNPGLVQIIQHLDPTLFYRYAYDYGFGKITGIELSGEEAGVMTRVFQDDGSILMVDYSTLSFGQGLMTTPIQLLSALSCVVNNGYYMQPTVVSASQNKGITSNGSKTSTKQIISSATSKEMRTIMQNVILNNSQLAPLAEGYSIGGKTGTAQKVENGTYSHTKYVTSFFGFTPVDDPEYAAIVVIDEAGAGIYGQQAAAPYGIDILKQVTDYENADDSSGTAMETTEVTVPDLVGQNVSYAKQILDDKGIKYRIDGSESGVVTAQSLAAKSTYDGKTTLVLETGARGASKVTMPDLTGMNIQEVNEILSGLELKLKVKGSGFATKQSVKAGKKIDRDTRVTVTFEQDSDD